MGAALSERGVIGMYGKHGDHEQLASLHRLCWLNKNSQPAIKTV